MNNKLQTEFRSESFPNNAMIYHCFNKRKSYGHNAIIEVLIIIIINTVLQ